MRWALSLSVCLLLFTSTAARALTLGFDPEAASVAPGSSVEVRIVISGLADSAAPSLGSFDLGVAYDPAIVQLTGVTFGDSALGDQLDLMGLGSISSFDDSVAGALSLYEISLDLAADLDTLQAGSFGLATLSFDTIGSGSTPLTLQSVVLGDANGDPLAAELVGGSIRVPEPALAALALAAGLMGSFRRLRMR